MASNHKLYKGPNFTVLEIQINKNDDNTIKVVMNWISRKKSPRMRSIKIQLHIIVEYILEIHVHE